MPIHDIQSAKFPPTLKYGFASLVVVMLVRNVNENHMRNCNSFVVHIGKNAIFYYFAQGVGSFVIYYAVNCIQTSGWLFKWCMVFGINLLITAGIAEGAIVTYAFFERIFLESCIYFQTMLRGEGRARMTI